MSSKFFGLSTIIVLLLAFAPNWILSFPEVQDKIRTETAKAIDANVTLSSASWRWFPLPHLCFDDFSMYKKEFRLDAPVLSVYPVWLSIFQGNVGIDGIVLEDADFLLKSVSRQEKRTKPPFRWIKVVNGRFRLSSGTKLDFLPLKNKRPDLSSLYGRIEIDGDILSGKVGGKTSFASRIFIAFSCNLADMGFSLNSKIEHLDMAGLYYKDITTRAQFPAKGFLDVHLEAHGRAFEHMDGSLEAASACLISKTKKPEAAFSCGSLKLTFSYSPDEISVLINQLEFAQPNLRLQGNIRLDRKKDGNRLLVDLEGRDIDLGQVRRSVLILLKGHKDAQKVCNIVRGGKASRLSFHFDDDPRYLESLHCMTIEGELEDVPVYVPDQDLFIDSVSGSMKIVGAVLHLENGRMRLRNSHGFNGIFVLGVADHNHEMELDIDLDADLRDVKWALKKFVHKDVLQRELKEVSKTYGRVQGRLMLGDDERHFDTFVDVTSVKAGFFYNRFNWPIKINGGLLSYQDDTLAWKGLSGEAGSNRVACFTGELSWKGRDRLRVEKFSGNLDVPSILDLSPHFKPLEKVREELALKARGRVAVERLSGRIFLDDPRGVTYKGWFKPDGLSVETRLLPGELHVREGSFFLDNNTLKAPRCKVDLSSQEFYASFDLRHHNLKDWQGRLGFTGTVNHAIAKWIEGHGWVPKEYFPKIPVHLKDLNIGLLEQGHEHVSGKLVWKNVESEALIDIDVAKDFLDIRQVRVRSRDETGTFRLLLDEGMGKRFSLGWNGRLSGSALDRCLRKNDILKGRLEGDFSMEYLADPGKGFSQPKGHLSATHLYWLWGTKNPLLMQALDVEAKGNSLFLQTKFRFLQDTIVASGDVSLVGNKVTAYLDVYGKKLSDDSLQVLFEEGTGRPVSIREAPPPNRASFFHEWNLDVGGEISFGFDAVELDLNSRFNVSSEKTGPRIVKVQGVNGYGQFSSSKFTDIKIFGKSFCGLKLNASVEVDKAGKEERSLVITSQEGEEIQFEDFLKCLGFKQHVLSGPFTVEMEMVSPDGILAGSGGLKLHARDGNIKRFGLLSRILGVVNLVDLFSIQPGIGLIEGGFPYDEIVLNSRIDKGVMELEQAVIKGRGLNLYGTGTVDIRNRKLDLIVFVAPLKTVDKIITSVPIIGAIIGGKHKSLITVPVKVEGPWVEPAIRTMPAKAVADVFKKLLFNVLKAPFSIFSKMGVEPPQDSKAN